jgi:CubicO group peptidase (beta-lactamase class C family)
MVTDTQQELQRTSPEQQGVASSAILAFIEALDRNVHDVHGVMLLRHGSVIAEGWWSPYRAEYPHMLFSLSKSFTSTAVGLAVSEGYFSLNDPIVSFFLDEAPAKISDNLVAMRVRDLLSMSSGHGADTWIYTDDTYDIDWTPRLLAQTVVHQPGTQFVYNSGATYLLSALVQKTTGQNLIDYLTPRLFEPLGIENPTWSQTSQGVSLGGIGLKITTEDIARFGHLYLQHGLWNGQQLLPENWIAEATSAQASNGDPAVASDWTQGYGFQFWRCQHNIYRGDGAFGQLCIVMPEQDAVLAITGGYGDMQQVMELTWEHLLPAMNTDTLPENTEAHTALTDKLSHLRLPTVQGQVTSSIASQVSGRTYQVDANQYGIQTLSLNFTESGCTLTVKTDSAKESFSAGHNVWQHGETSLFNQTWMFGKTLIASSGAWITDQRYTIVIRMLETPFVQTLHFDFTGDTLQIESRVNLSFDTTEPVLLTAHVV